MIVISAVQPQSAPLAFQSSHRNRYSGRCTPSMIPRNLCVRGSSRPSMRSSAISSHRARRSSFLLRPLASAVCAVWMRKARTHRRSDQCRRTLRSITQPLPVGYTCHGGRDHGPSRPPSAKSGPSRTVIPAHCGQRSGDRGQFLMIDIGKNTFHLVGLNERGAIILESASAAPLFLLTEGADRLVRMSTGAMPERYRERRRCLLDWRGRAGLPTAATPGSRGGTPGSTAGPSHYWKTHAIDKPPSHPDCRAGTPLRLLIARLRANGHRYFPRLCRLCLNGIDPEPSLQPFVNQQATLLPAGHSPRRTQCDDAFLWPRWPRLRLPSA